MAGLSSARISPATVAPSAGQRCWGLWGHAPAPLIVTVSAADAGSSFSMALASVPPRLEEHAVQRASAGQSLLCLGFRQPLDPGVLGEHLRKIPSHLQGTRIFDHR